MSEIGIVSVKICFLAIALMSIIKDEIELGMLVFLMTIALLLFDIGLELKGRRE